MKNNKYNYGIATLKIISMVMICILHILGQGGILDNTIYLSSQYKTAWFMEIFSYSAVNCFALISGYNNLNKTIKYNKFLYLWGSIIFYNIIIGFIFSLFLKQNLFSINMFMPIITDEYWYFSGYFLLFLLMPILNAGINNCDKKYFKNILLMLVIIIICSFKYQDVFLLNNGYSTLWLIILYIIGAYIKKYNPFKNINKNIFMLIFILSNFFIFLSKIFLETIRNNNGIINDVNIFINYTSLPIIISSIFLFLFFERSNIKENNLIKIFSKHAFFSYIIHCNPFVWENLIKNSFIFCSTLSSCKIIFIVILSAVFIFICSVLIDILKEKLFIKIKI